MNTEPLRAPQDPDEVVRLDIKLGTPVCEMSTGTLGQAVGVTGAYCIYRINSKEAECSFSVARWRDIAVGNVAPSWDLLPKNWDEIDRLDSYAALFRDLAAIHPNHMTSTLETTLQEIYVILTDKLSTKGAQS